MLNPFISLHVLFDHTPCGLECSSRKGDTQERREQPQQMTEKQTEAVLRKQNQSSFRTRGAIFAQAGSHRD